MHLWNKVVPFRYMYQDPVYLYRQACSPLIRFFFGFVAVQPKIFVDMEWRRQLAVYYCLYWHRWRQVLIKKTYLQNTWKGPDEKKGWRAFFWDMASLHPEPSWFSVHHQGAERWFWHLFSLYLCHLHRMELWRHTNHFCFHLVAISDRLLRTLSAVEMLR